MEDNTLEQSVQEEHAKQVFVRFRDVCFAFVRIATDYACRLDEGSRDQWANVAVFDFLEQELGPLPTPPIFEKHLDDLEDLLQEMVVHEIRTCHDAGIVATAGDIPSDPKPGLHRQLLVLASLMAEIVASPYTFQAFTASAAFRTALEEKTISGPFDHRIAELFRDLVNVSIV